MIDFVIYYGIANALVFGCLLIYLSDRNSANLYLGLLIASLGFDLSIELFLNDSVFNSFPVLHLLPFGILFGLGPLLYAYVSKMTGSYFSKWHLLWFMMDYPHSLFHLINGRGSEPYLIHEVVDKMGVLSIPVLFFYLYKGFQLLNLYQRDLPNRLSNYEEQTLSWLKQLLKLFFVFVPIYMIFWFLLMADNQGTQDRLPAYSFVNFLIIWLGVAGIRQRGLHFSVQSKDINTNDGSFKEAHLRELVSCMESDKLYLIPNLNVRYLEDKLGIGAKEISLALNNGLGKNFYSFINEYRVEEFKKRATKDSHLTLAGLAMECGFSSKSTFQRVFKEITGQSPTSFLNN